MREWENAGMGPGNAVMGKCEIITFFFTSFVTTRIHDK